MNLQDFDEVQPDWRNLASMTNDQISSARDVLLAALLADRPVSSTASGITAEILTRLPGPGTSTPADVRRWVGEFPSRYEGVKWTEFFERVSDRIDDPDARLALLRLVAIVLAIDGATEREQEYCYACGAAFDIDLETVEDVLRSAWETHEHQVTEEQTGQEHHIPPIRGAGWARDRDDSGEYVFMPREV